VLFPALADAPRSAGSEGSARAGAPRARLHGRVLVVDDEQAVGTFMGDLLESWGLEVTVTSSAAEAASLFGDDERRFDLVITDQVMPRKTGSELARELLAIRPDLPVILYTGFNEEARGEIDDIGLRAVVGKPVDPHALFGLLQTHLPHAA
jgi:CheY-like chemotaxis protein